MLLILRPGRECSPRVGQGERRQRRDRPQPAAAAHPVRPVPQLPSRSRSTSSPSTLRRPEHACASSRAEAAPGTPTTKSGSGMCDAPRVRQVWPWVGGVVAVAALMAAVYVNQWRSDDPAPWSCDRGLRSEDWKPFGHDDRVRTGRAIAKCGWVDGWTRQEVEARLGPSDSGTRKRFMSYELGDCDCGLGPTHWFLVLRFSPGTGGRVVEAEADPSGV